MSNLPKAFVVLGPTSSGKSDLAVELGLKYSGEVISADSRQIYRGLDIGTGKITENEMRGVYHHLLNIRDPLETYSTAEYKRDAENCIGSVLSRGNLPIICGGTGFYISTVTENMVLPEVPPNAELRDELERLSSKELVSRLETLDTKRAEKIDKENRRRIIRAIEIAETLGSVPEVSYGEKKYDFLKIGLGLPYEELKKRIERRLDKRLEEGMIEESEQLLQEGKLTFERMKKLGLEYRYIALLLEGSLTREEFRTQLLFSIWHYAKRQMRWFVRDKEIVWFDPSDKEEVLNCTTIFLNS